MEWEPRIVAFLCNWCSYSAADQAGAAKLAVPGSVRVIRTMCSGRIDPTFILRAFARGADGVLVCGCHSGDCHYISGNHKALGRIHLLRRVVAQLGIEPERLRLEWVSAKESERFATLAREMTDAVRALGPLAWREVEELHQPPALAE